MVFSRKGNLLFFPPFVLLPLPLFYVITPLLFPAVALDSPVIALVSFISNAFTGFNVNKFERIARCRITERRQTKPLTVCAALTRCDVMFLLSFSFILRVRGRFLDVDILFG